MHHWVVLHRMLLRLGLLVGRLLLLLLNKLLRRHMLLRVVLLLVLLLLLLLVLLLQALVQAAPARVPANSDAAVWHTRGETSAATSFRNACSQPQTGRPCQHTSLSLPPAQQRTRCCGPRRPVSPPEGRRPPRPAAAAPLACAQTASC